MRTKPRPTGASRGWGPWLPGVLPEVDPARAAEIAAHTGMTAENTARVLQEMRAADKVWMNAVYQVNIRECGEAPGGWPRMLHLSIKRRDKQPSGRERFRDFQRIKNDLVGPEHEGVELYPAEARLVDSANQYHVFVLADPKVRFPFGFADRLVLRTSGAGAVQQPFAEEDPA